MARHTTTRFSSLDCIATAALACYVITLLPFWPRGLSNVCGMVLCFVLTGLAGSRALFPGSVSGLVRLTTVTAFAMGAGIVGGLIVDLLPTGFTRTNWVTYALITTLVAYAVARYRASGEALDWRRPKFRKISGVAWAQILTSGLILTAAILITVTSKSFTEKPFTELWLVPDGAERSASSASSALLGLKSHESSIEDFTVVMDTGKRVMRAEVKLAPDQVWTQKVPLEGDKAVATVYRYNATDQPYRTVFLVTE